MLPCHFCPFSLEREVALIIIYFGVVGDLSSVRVDCDLRGS